MPRMVPRSMAGDGTAQCRDADRTRGDAPAPGVRPDRRSRRNALRNRDPRRLDREDAVLAPGALDPLALGDAQALADCGPGLPRLDEVVEERPPRGDVRVDLPAHRLHELVAHRVALLLGRRLDLLAEDDVHG